MNTRFGNDVRPVPCHKFIGRTSYMQQMMHIAQEVNESWEALSVFIESEHFGGEVEKNARKHLAEELTDVITSATTMLEMIGYDEKARERMQAFVNEKNYERGYLEAEKEEY